MTEESQDQDRLDLGDVLDGQLADGEYGEFEPERRPLVDDQGRVRLSFSRVDAWEQCGLKFRYRYVDRLPTAPRSYLSFGTSVHTALEAFHERTLFGMPSEEELLGFLYDGWDSAGFADQPREEQVTQYRRAQDVLRRYHARTAPTYRPAAETEAWFELPIADRAIVVGSIDRVDVDDDGRFHVVDYKTGKLRSVAHVRESLQLSIYALACEHLYGQLPATVALDFVVAGTPVVVAVEDLDLAGAEERILQVADAVVAEDYAPTPNRLCNWCDYRQACPAWEGDGPELLGPAALRVQQLRRQLARDVQELRVLEERLPELAAAAEDAAGPVPPSAVAPTADATVTPATTRDSHGTTSE